MCAPRHAQTPLTRTSDDTALQSWSRVHFLDPTRPADAVTRPNPTRLRLENLGSDLTHRTESFIKLNLFSLK